MRASARTEFTFKAASEQFLLRCQSIVNHSQHTIRAYRCDLRNATQHFGATRRIGTIDREALRSYIGQLRDVQKLKETSIRRRIACLKVFFRWAVDESLLGSSPFDTLKERIRLPKRLPRTLNHAEIALLRKALGPSRSRKTKEDIRDRAIVHVLLDTGVRVGELTSIQLEDLSLPDSCIRVRGKGNRQRLVYLLYLPLFQALQAYVTRARPTTGYDDSLFLRSDGHAFTTNEIRRVLREFADRAGIQRRVTPHMLRHTCATQWLELGLDTRYVQKLLGHQSISTTEIYTHVSDQGLRGALVRTMAVGSR